MSNHPSIDRLPPMFSSIYNPMEDEDASWVDVHQPSSRGSGSSIAICTDPDEKLLIDAQRENSCPASLRGSRHSPKGLASPNVELVSASLEQVRYKLKQDSNWTWDWSSRPEKEPPKHWLRRAPNTNGTATATDTPPNSPIPSPSSMSEVSLAYSLRHSKCIRSRYFSVEYLAVLFASHVAVMLMGAGLGWYLCKRQQKLSAFVE